MSHRDTLRATTPLAGDTPPPARCVLLGIWLGVAGYLQLRHVPWRDEVRAYTIAIQGDNVWAMLRALHGEGHPALWYLLLRGVHVLVGSTVALPLAGFAIGAAAAALFALRAPFRPAALALALFGAYALFDYTIVARNYGISMLLLFLFADRYPRWRDRGVGLGVILFLLCNSNAPSVLLAAALLLFWAVELVSEQGLRWTPAMRHLATNTAIAALGVAACVATIYPPYNDAVDALSTRGGVARSWSAMLDLPASFDALSMHGIPGGGLFLGVVIVGAAFGVARRPAGLAATLGAFLLLGGFFSFVFPGYYRHQALYIVFLLAIYWLCAAGRGGRWPSGRWLPSPRIWSWVGRAGGIAFVALLALQVVMALLLTTDVVHGGVYSRSRDLAAILQRPALAGAVVIANPDIMLEPLPYYVDNPLYFVRERRWGRVVAFTRAAKRSVSLGEMLATARRLRAHTGRPVVVVLRAPLNPADPAGRWDQGYLGDFTTTPDQVRAFLAATDRLARFAPAQTDESYDVYRLRDPSPRVTRS